MKDKEGLSRMVKEAGVLFAITLIAGIVLGFVYELTKEPIRQQKELAVRKACQEVFADADSFRPLEDGPSHALTEELAAEGVQIGTVYEACLADGSLAGYVVESTSTEGYGGDITLYAGVTLTGHLNGISILEIDETPGLGMNADKVLVPQFQEKDVSLFTYTKKGSTTDSEIDAISGATYTTAAVTSAVNGALQVVEEAQRKAGEDALPTGADETLPEAGEERVPGDDGGEMAEADGEETGGGEADE